MSRSTRTLAWLALSLLLVGGSARASDGEAIKAFKKAFAAAETVEEQSQAIGELGGVGSEKAAGLLLKLSLSPSLEQPVQERALELLASYSDASVLDWASELLAKSKDKRERVLAAEYLAGRARFDAAVGLRLLPALSDKAWAVQSAAIDGLMRTRQKQTVAALIALLEDEGTAVRVMGDAMGALKVLTGEKHGSAEEWTSWWKTKAESWTPAAAPKDEGEQDRFRTVTRLQPGSVFGEVKSSNVVFVVDRSYSMRVPVFPESGGQLTRLNYVQRELEGVLDRVVEDSDRFNVIAFGDEVTPFKKKLVRGSDKTRRKARIFVRGFEPEGDTNIYGALKAAFDHPDVDTIYFLTDGTPSKGEIVGIEEILAEVRKWNRTRKVRLNTIAFMSGDPEPFGVIEAKDVAELLLKSLAEQNGGTYTMFDSAKR